jgi:thiol-disulfide isomerase/thioredoxin
MRRRIKKLSLAMALAAIAGVAVGQVAQRRRDAELDSARIAVRADQLRPEAAIDFALPALGGGTLHLGELKGKVLLVTFWATWCPPCRAEEPSLRRLTRRFSPESFQLVTVSVDEDWDAVDRFFAGRKPPYAVALDRDSAVARSWGTSRFPESYVLDARGNLRLKFVGARDWTDLDTLTLLHSLGAQGL